MIGIVGMVWIILRLLFKFWILWCIYDVEFFNIKLREVRMLFIELFEVIECLNGFILIFLYSNKIIKIYNKYKEVYMNILRYIVNEYLW